MSAFEPWRIGYLCVYLLVFVFTALWIPKLQRRLPPILFCTASCLFLVPAVASILHDFTEDAFAEWVVWLIAVGSLIVFVLLFYWAEWTLYTLCGALILYILPKQMLLDISEAMYKVEVISPIFIIMFSCTLVFIGWLIIRCCASRIVYETWVQNTILSFYGGFGIAYLVAVSYDVGFDDPRFPCDPPSDFPTWLWILIVAGVAIGRLIIAGCFYRDRPDGLYCCFISGQCCTCCNSGVPFDVQVDADDTD